MSWISSSKLWRGAGSVESDRLSLWLPPLLLTLPRLRRLLFWVTGWEMRVFMVD